MGIGFWQILIVLLVVLIVFGAGRLPKVMGDFGKGIRNFKAGLNGTEPEGEDKEPPRLSGKDEQK
jgi:sec-independent protein translocase protein TatA